MFFNRITQAPLPRWVDLFSLFFTSTPEEEELSDAWIKEGDTAFWVSRSAWSMVVIARLRQRMKKSSRLTIWVPAFFCNESLTLLRDMGAQFVFYPVDEQSQPDFDKFPTFTEENRPDMFLLVHYFGVPARVGDALSICKKYGAWLIEDAAHVLHPVASVGEVGDFVLYSPHKHLAIHSGALLLLTSSGPSGLAKDSEGLEILKVIMSELSTQRKIHFDQAVWLAKRVLQLLGVGRRNKIKPFASCRVDSPKINILPLMGGMSKRLLQHEIARLPYYSAHRVQCLAEWDKVIQGLCSNNLIHTMSFSEAPYLAYVNTKNQKAAELLYVRFHKVGVPVSTWPDLPPEVSGDSVYDIEDRLRHTRMYLPVHQSVKVKQIKSYGKKLKELYLADWSLKPIKSKKAWDSLWKKCPRKSLPQTWEYGAAKSIAEGWNVQRFVVLNEEGQSVALFQVLLKGVPGLGWAARVNRGPLMLIEDTNIALISIALLVKESKRRRWWMMQMAPLLSPEKNIGGVLKELRFKKKLVCPMDSALISLEAGEDELLMGFKGKWRNCLRKGQKLRVKVILDDGSSKHFQWLLNFYQTQQCQKDFEGTSKKMLRALYFLQSDEFKFNLLLAVEGTEVKENSLLGVLVTLQYGDYSEYLIGATNDKGRANQANSVLLWEAILHAKHSGCNWFDVGGLSDSTPKGIASFKKGLNPEPYTLIGEWRKWF